MFIRSLTHLFVLILIKYWSRGTTFCRSFSGGAANTEACVYEQYCRGLYAAKNCYWSIDQKYVAPMRWPFNGRYLTALVHVFSASRCIYGMQTTGWQRAVASVRK